MSEATEYHSSLERSQLCLSLVRLTNPVEPAGDEGESGLGRESSDPPGAKLAWGLYFAGAPSSAVPGTIPDDPWQLLPEWARPGYMYSARPCILGFGGACTSYSA